MLKRYFFTASAAAFIASSPAFAGSPAPAPLEPVITAPVASAPAFSWAGGYAGVNVGYGGDKAKHPWSYTQEYTSPGSEGSELVYSEQGSDDVTSSGFAGGAQVGWNFQRNSMVYGIEADYQSSGIKGEFSSSYSDSYGDSDSMKFGTKLKHFGTIRARLGHTVTDRFLVYGTAGFASGKTETYVNGMGLGDMDDGPQSWSKSKTRNGWTAGIGAEYAFTDNWSLKSEYLYTDLGKTNVFADGISGDGLSESLNVDRKFNFHMVRVGLNYHF